MNADDFECSICLGKEKVWSSCNMVHTVWSSKLRVETLFHFFFRHIQITNKDNSLWACVLRKMSLRRFKW